jgi:hypothetical protein
VVELNNQTLVKPVANFYTANGITNPLNVGRGYPVTAVSTQLGDNSVWLAWIDNTGNVNAAYLPQNDVIPAGRGLHTVTGANAMPGATVTALVQSPGKLALFWSDAAGGTIWAAYFDCVFQTTCSLATGGWSLALQVNATAGEPAGSTIAAIQPVPGTIHLFFTHANDHSCPPDASCGSIWGQTGTVITNTLGLTYWAPKANVFGGAGALLPGGVNNGVDLTAVTTVPSGGVNLFWSLDVAYGSPTGYGSIQSATCPASCKTLNQFGQAQTVGSPSNSRSYFATPITAIPNLNGMNNGQVTLFWESQDVTGAGTGAGDVMTSSLSGTGGTWSNPEGLFGRTVLVP